MIYISLKNLASNITNNSWKCRTVDPKGIIGIPRSGMMIAVMLSEKLHLGCCSFNEFIDSNGEDSVFYRHGRRPIEIPEEGSYLVVEDSWYNGSAVQYINMLRKLYPDKKFVSVAAYLEGPCRIGKPDIALSDIRKESLNDPALPQALYWWNIYDSYFNGRFMFDLDGVLCLDPPSDMNTEAYEDYLKHPVPKHIPVMMLGASINVCTYRLRKYEQETRDFLVDQGLSIGSLYMFQADTKEERNRTSPAEYKAKIYASHPELVLFIESNDAEAQEICRITGKYVYCVDSDRMYRKAR